MPSPKQEIYALMLRFSLPDLRGTLSSFKSPPGCNVFRIGSITARGREAYELAELIHNLPVSLLDEAFTDHDIWFLNVQARTYVEWGLQRALRERPSCFDTNMSLIAELFKLVPEEMRGQLKWDGPSEEDLREAAP